MDCKDALYLPRQGSPLPGACFTNCERFLPRSLCLQVLEYMGGGNLLNLLIERDTFPEDFTRFYIAEVQPPSQ